SELHLKTEIKKRVNTAHAVALNIYNNNSGKKDHHAIQEMITDAVIPLLTTDKKKLFIIGNMSGEILFSKNKSPLSSNSSTAIASFKEITDIIKSKDEAYSSWTVQDAPSEIQADNIIFAKLFKPMNLIISTGFYLKDVVAEAKTAALEKINNTRYGDKGEGYLFAFQYDGLYLSHPVPDYIGQNLIDITDPNGVKINRDIVKTCQSGGGFTNYVWDRYKTGQLIDKISYVKGYEEWEWVIGTGFYLDDLQQTINVNNDILQDQIKSFFLKISIFSILIFIISSLIIRLVVGKLNAELAIFHNFFNKAAIESEEISLVKINFLEFEQLAENANKMLENRQSMESALVKSEKRFRNLVGGLPKIAVQGYDTNRNVIYWNRASEILYGYSKEEAMGKRLEDLIIPEPMKEFVIQAIHDWYKHDIAIPSSEHLLQHKDGSDVPVYSSHVVLVSSKGNKEMYCVDIDIADLKLAQKKEQQNAFFYRQLFDHSTSGVAVYEAIENGKDFIFKDFNKAGEKIDNIDRDALLGRRVTEVFPGVKEFGLFDVFRQVWQTGVPALHPVSCYKDGILQGWRENKVYKLPTGEIVAVYDDITKQKQLEEEKQAFETRLNRA
ncbi:MAG: cache domain-containing protein, partial [Desulfocapsa sp.]|nr:cache domain-containing protein [Desulfocapsa sp.]